MIQHVLIFHQLEFRFMRGLHLGTRLFDIIHDASEYLHEVPALLFKSD